MYAWSPDAGELSCNWDVLLTEGSNEVQVLKTEKGLHQNNDHYVKLSWKRWGDDISVVGAYESINNP